MNFAPNTIHKVSNPDGTKTRVESWDYSTLAGVELAGLLSNLMIGAFFGCITSPFLALSSLLSFNGRFNAFNIVGILISGYFLYDSYNGWILLSLLSIFLPESVINFLVYINIIAIVIHVVFLFGILIHKYIVKNFDTEGTRVRAFVIFIICLILIGYNIAGGTLAGEKGWVDRNVAARVSEIINN